MTQLLGVLFGVVVGFVISYWQTRYQARQNRLRDRIAFLKETLRELVLQYGQAREFLYLEDAVQASSKDFSGFAKTLGTFSGFALAVNDSEINGQVEILWIPRPDNASRAIVQKAFEDVISRLGFLINQAHDEEPWVGALGLLARRYGLVAAPLAVDVVSVLASGVGDATSLILGLNKKPSSPVEDISSDRDGV